MKKFLFGAVALFGLAFGAFAQDEYAVAPEATYSTGELDSLRAEIDMLKARADEQDLKEKYNSIWKRTKFMNISYVSQTLSNKSFPMVPDDKSRFGFSLNLGNTYFLHRKPLAGFMKIGLDVVWFDLNYVNYKKPNINISGIVDGINGAGDIMDNYDDYDYDYDDFDFEDLEDELDFGKHQLEIGIGVGPSIHFAPFSSFSNGLEHLRAQLYFHFTPSYSVCIISEDGDTEIHHGFCPVFNFGGAISYKMIGLGVEGRWGTAKYNGFDFEDEYGEDVSEKVKYSTSSVRAFIRFCF